MDKLIYTALNSLDNLRSTQIVSAQNLANQNVPGYRRDLNGAAQAFTLDDGSSFSSRAVSQTDGKNRFSSLQGYLNQTDEKLDIAISDEGYFYVQPDGGGQPALSRRGDLRVQPDGTLVNGAGEQVLSQGMQPIVLPPFRDIVIDDTGRITVAPQDGAPGEMIEIASIGTTLASGVKLTKGLDGQIRPESGPVPRPDQGAKVLQGVLEGSNVNSTAELIDSIDLQRSFELNMRMVSTAKELDEAGVSLMRLPQA